MKKALWVIGLGISLCLTSGSAQNKRKPIFVSPEQLDMTAILAAPPANDSWQTLAELAELHRIQETRTSEEIARAKQDDAEESIFIFRDVLGAKFSREALPLTALLSDHVKNDEGVIVGPTKRFFQRARPYHLDATLKPVCKMTENRADFGYPSGHGTAGYLEAMVLIQIVPEQRNGIMRRADDFAHNREVCGVHYSSDEMASKAVAYSMMAIMMNHPQFQKELQTAKAETRAALGLPAAPSAPGSR